MVETTDDVMKKYGAKIENEMNEFNSQAFDREGYSSSYRKFRESMVPELSSYERWARSLGGVSS